MPRCGEWFGRMKSGVVCGLLAAAAVSFDSPARAECILQPTQQPPEGAHWSLHLDRSQNRRCWILVDAAGHEVSMPQPQQPAPSTALSSLQEFLSKLTGGQPAPQVAPQPQEAPARPAASPPPRKPQPSLANANRASPSSRVDQKADGRTIMTRPERDALFEEFLRWRESQHGAANPPPPPSQ